MAEKKVIDVEAPVEKPQEPQVIAEIHIQIMDDGGIALNVPDSSRELQPIEIEQITRTVYDQLRDARVAQLALEAFKQRLG